MQVIRTWDTGGNTKSIVVAPSPRGGWAVMRMGNKRPSRVKRTKDEAVRIGMAYAKESRAALLVYDDTSVLGEGPVALTVATE